MTRPDRTKAERALAFYIAQIRPDWDEHGVLVILRKCASAPLAQLGVAAIHAAKFRTDQRTPAVIALDGEHWQALDRGHGQAASNSSPAPEGPQCSACGKPERQCRTLAAKTGDLHPFQPVSRNAISDPAQVRAIRERAAHLDSEVDR